MITIENRSAFFVTVPKHSHLDRTFAKEFLSADELRSALGVAHQVIDEAVASKRLFALEGPGGQPYYPAFYADADVDRSVLELVAQELRDLSAALKFHFFVSKCTNLGETPLEALKRGRGEEVLEAAPRFANA